MENKMKQFNLDLYLQNPNIPLVTRDGCKARILCTNRANAVSPIVALVQKKTNKIEEPITYYEDGRFLCSEASPYDLFFADYTPGNHEGWVNIIRNEVYNEAFCGKIYASKEEAESYANSATLATARIEWEEE